MHCACTTERFATAVLRSGEAEYVTECPQQRHLGIDLELLWRAVHTNRDTHRRTSSRGHSAPVSTHAATIAPSCSCVPGAGSRSWPGDQPHATSALSWALCSTIASSDLPPLRFGSFSCSQIWCGVLPTHAISLGARCQSGAPGTRACARLRS